MDENQALLSLLEILNRPDRILYGPREEEN